MIGGITTGDTHAPIFGPKETRNPETEPGIEELASPSNGILLKANESENSGLAELEACSRC